jgi:hypothetical protein
MIHLTNDESNRRQSERPAAFDLAVVAVRVCDVVRFYCGVEHREDELTLFNEVTQLLNKQAARAAEQLYVTARVELAARTPAEKAP